MNSGDWVHRRRSDDPEETQNGSCEEKNRSANIYETHTKKKIDVRSEGRKDLMAEKITEEKLRKRICGGATKESGHPASCIPWSTCEKYVVEINLQGTNFGIWDPTSHNPNVETLFQK